MNIEELINKEALQEQVREEVAERLLEDLRQDLRKEIRESVLTDIRKTINNEILSIITEVISKPLKRTNNYGEDIASETTLVEMIADAVKKFLTVKSYRKEDGYGKTNFSETTYSPTHTGFDAMIVPIIDEQVKSVVADNTKEMVTAIRKETNQALLAVLRKEVESK